MRKKLPDDAFEVYRALGPARSYEAVADRFGVGKRSVVKRAVKEDWQGRLGALEREERGLEVKALREARMDLKTRQHKLIQALQAKALETLKSAPLKSGMDAVRTLDLSLRQERELLFEGSNSPGAGNAAEDSQETQAEDSSKYVVLGRWFNESPTWQIEIPAVTRHWGPNDPRASQTICDLLFRICDWIERVLKQSKVSRNDSFHVLALHAFAFERDLIQRAQASEWIFELERELEAYRVRRKVPDDNYSWEVFGVHVPGHPHGESLGWGERFGSADFCDPVSFIAARLRKAKERQTARDKNARRPSAEGPTT